MSAHAWQYRRNKPRPMLVYVLDDDGNPWARGITFPSRGDLARDRRLASSRRRVTRRQARRVTRSFPHGWRWLGQTEQGWAWVATSGTRPTTPREAMRLLGYESRAAADNLRAFADAWFPLPGEPS